MRRRAAAVTLFVLSLLFAARPLGQVARNVPVTVTAARDGGTVELRVDDVTVLTPSECVIARWDVDQIKAVEFDGDGVTGEGSRQVCDGEATLDVTFRNGSTESYTIPIQALADRRLNLILLIGAVAALCLSLSISRLPAALWNRVRVTRAGMALSRRFPAAPAPATLSRGTMLLAMAAILLIGAATRTHYLSKQVSSDESWTVVDFASESPSQIVQDYRAPNNHIFHTLLVHEAIALFGLQAWTMRLPAYFAGILMIAAAFAVGRRFYNVYVGLLAAALTASAGWVVGYSVSARGYTIITLIFLLLLPVAFSLLKRRRLTLWLAFAALSVVGLYTIPTMAYAIGLAAVWLGLSIVLGKRGRERFLWLRDLILTGALIAFVTVALYLPALRQVAKTPGSDVEFDNLAPIDRDDADEAYSDVVKVIWEEINIPWATLAPLLAAGALMAVLLHPRLSRYRVSLIASAAIWLPPAILIPSLTTYSRVWLFLQPLYFIVAGAGLIYLIRGIAPRAFTVGRGLLVAAAPVLAAGLALNLTANVPIDSVNVTSRVSVDTAIARIGAEIQPGDYAICDWFCPEFVLQADIEHLPFYSPITFTDALSDEHSFTLAPGHALYIVTRSLDDLSRQDMKDILTQLRIPYKAVSHVSLVVDLSDTIIYRLEFSRALQVAAGERNPDFGA